MHAHTHLPHKYINTDIHMYHADVYVYIYIYIHTYNPSFVRAAIPTLVATRACACPHGCARTRARASAAPPRTTARAAPTTRPSASRLRWPRRSGRRGGAYKSHVRHRRGVPRADVRVERRRRVERLRAEPAVHTDGTRSHASARMRARPIAHAHARARTQHVRACVRRARIGDPFIG